ncbi:UTRA domain-containing protein [Collinsella aerofaciens]|uniref:UTRA domain-containing protein n=1 Tax=Collinsella aerofaciens TaxID=74426 RepID=UPI00321B978A
MEALGARDAGLLGLEQGDLVLLLECVSYDASGQAIEYVKSFNRGDTGGYTYTY